MKCLNCRLSIPFAAQACGYCGHPTVDQKRNTVKLYLSIALGAIPFVVTPWKYAGYSFVAMLVIALLSFKFLFRGEFSKF